MADLSPSSREHEIDIYVLVYSRLQRALDLGIAIESEMEADHDTSINDRIASETKILHERNNKLASLKMIMALRSAETWREYVRTFYWLFLVFEEEVRKIRETGSGHLAKAFDTVHEPVLLRTKKIRQDLEFYYNSDKTVWEECTSAEGRAYMSHVQEIAKTSPVRLLAYISVMYLGLFAGGQIIRSKIVKRTGFYPAKSGLSHEQLIERGTKIFQFDTDDTSTLKRTHRARFDRVCHEYLNQAEQDEICAEAKEIFIRNERLIESVDVPGAWILIVKSFSTILFSALLVVALCMWLFVYYVR